MKIQTISFKNVGNIKALTIEMSSVVLVKGQNAEGKSSIVNGIIATFDAGHKPDLIGPYGKKAEVEIIVDRGNGRTAKIKRSILPSASEYTLSDETGAKLEMDSPAKWVKSLVSGLTLNPAALMQADKKKRLEFLQTVMPITFTRSEIEKACGGVVFSTLPEEVGIELFDRFFKGRFESRTDINRDLKQAESTEASLMSSLPAESDQDWIGEANRFQVLIDNARKELSELQDDASKEINNEILRIKDKLAEDIKALQAQASKDIAHVSKVGSEQLAAMVAPLSENIERWAREHESAKAKAMAQERSQGVRDSLKTVRADIDTKKSESLRLDSQLDQLKLLRLKKIEKLPVPGVEVRDGQIFYFGKNIDTQLNKAQQILVWFQIAAQAVEDGLPFFILDNAESLDAASTEQLVEACKESGFQLLMAEVVKQGELTVAAV